MADNSAKMCKAGSTIMVNLNRNISTARGAARKGGEAKERADANVVYCRSQWKKHKASCDQCTKARGTRSDP